MVSTSIKSNQKSLFEIYSKIDDKRFIKTWMETFIVIRYLDRSPCYRGGSYIRYEKKEFTITTLSFVKEHDSIVEYLQTLVD